jgi:transposase
VGRSVQGTGSALARQPAHDRQHGGARSSACRGTQKNGEEAIGRSRGGLTTKIHAVVDGRGLPVGLALTPGQAHDLMAVPALIDVLPANSRLLGDKAYDADWFRACLRERRVRACIPPTRSRHMPRYYSKILYRQRNIIERFFNKIKHARRIATRFEKHAVNFLAAVQIVAILIWARFESTT